MTEDRPDPLATITRGYADSLPAESADPPPRSTAGDRLRDVAAELDGHGERAAGSAAFSRMAAGYADIEATNTPAAQADSLAKRAAAAGRSIAAQTYFEEGTR